MIVANEHLGLFDTPPSRGETRLAQALVGLLLIVLLALWPVSNLRLGEVTAFVPVVDAVMFVGELIIATLLFGQFAVFRSRALLLLASTFVFVALLLVGHALTFPGAFAHEGLLDPGASSTAWLMIIRRMALPIGVILYAVLKESEPETREGSGPSPPWTLVGIAGAVALAGATAALAIRGDHLLPQMFVDRTQINHFNLLAFNFSNLALVALAMAVLFMKRSSTLDVWLQVTLAGCLIQSLLNLPITARFTVGWYSLHLVVLFSHLFMLLALIAESNRLYVRLALSTAARRREREARMMSMDAVAAAISHEVGQPLAAMVLSAKASLNHLTRPQASPDNAIVSLRNTIGAGRRAFEVIRSVRTTFRSELEPLVDFSLNDLVLETTQVLAREFRTNKVSLELMLDKDLPLVRANRIQMQRVLVNLLVNAIEAVCAPRSHGRRVSIRSVGGDTENVLVEISDSGPGVSPEGIMQIFDPFYSTKSTGRGLGLALSRTIVEEHNGRLWASNGAQGAVFHLELPSSGNMSSREGAAAQG